MHLRLGIAILIAMLPLAASAERPGQYWGLNVDAAELDTPNDRRGNGTNLGLHVGYHFTDFLAAEVQVGGGNTDVSDGVRYAGAFGRFNLPFEQVNVYLLAGGAAVSFDQGPTEDRETETDLAAGVGVELFGNERTAVRLEYTNLADGTYEKLGLGFVHHFDWPAFR